MIGVRIETKYRVRVPKQATVRIRAQQISVKAMTGRVIANGINGAVTGDGLSGGVEARSVNGDTTIIMSALRGDLMDIRAINGNVNLTLPANANANLNASVIGQDGTIDIGELKFEPLGEQNQRRVRGKINAGGPPIEISATRGSVTIKAQ